MKRVTSATRLAFGLMTVALGLFGCSTSQKTSGGEEVEVAGADEQEERLETHSEWTGGGTIRLGDSTFELPADPRLAVAVHPEKAAQSVENVARIVGQARGNHLIPEGFAETFMRTSWPRLLPIFMFASLDGPDRLERVAERVVRTGPSALLGVRTPHLDTSRRLVAIMGTGRMRGRLRRKRLSIDGEREAPSALSVRMILPATDTAALADEFRGSCRRLEARQLEESRARLMRERGLSGDEAVERLADARWAAEFCGKIRTIVEKERYIVVDLVLDPARRSSGWEIPEELELEARRDHRWRRTPALAAFERESRSVSLFTTSRSTAALARLYGQIDLTSFQSAAYEFEDVLVALGNDGSGGFNLDVVQSYTERGKRVEEMGEIDEKLPTFDVPGEWMSATRAWSLRRASEASGVPHWVSASERPFPDDLLEEWEHKFLRDVHLFGAYPTMTLFRAWSDAADYERESLPTGAWGLQPSAARFAVGSKPSVHRTNPNSVLGAGVFRMMRGFEEYLDDDLRRGFAQLQKRGRFAVEETRTKGTGEESRYELAMNADWQALAGEPARADASLQFHADLETMAAAIRPGRDSEMQSFGRRLLKALASVRLTSRIGESARMTHLHVGPGDDRPMSEPEVSVGLASPSEPPRCLSSLIRRARSAGEDQDIRLYSGRHWRGSDDQNRRSELESLARTMASMREELESMRASCSGLDESEGADVRSVMAEFYRGYGYLNLALTDVGRAAEMLERSCKLGLKEACGTARMSRGVALPRVESVQALSRPVARYRIAGSEGISLMGRMVFDWQTFMELEVEVDDDQQRKARYDSERPLGRLTMLTDSVGGLAYSGERQVVGLHADRALPAAMIERLLAHVEEARPETYARPGVAFMVERDGLGPDRLAWHVYEGRQADDPGATVQITKRGIDIRVGGESMAPIEGCPSDGPTICATRSPEEIDRALAKSAGAFRDGDGEDSGDIDRLLEALRVGVLGDRLKAAADRAEASELQIIADGRVPLAVLSRVVAAGLFETESRNGRRQVRGELFDAFFLSVREPRKGNKGS